MTPALASGRRRIASSTVGRLVRPARDEHRHPRREQGRYVVGGEEARHLRRLSAIGSLRSRSRGEAAPRCWSAVSIVSPLSIARARQARSPRERPSSMVGPRSEPAIPAWAGRERLEHQPERFEGEPKLGGLALGAGRLLDDLRPVHGGHERTAEHRPHRAGARLALQECQEGGGVEHPRSTRPLPARLLAAFGDQLFGEAPAFELPGNRHAAGAPPLPASRSPGVPPSIRATRVSPGRNPRALRIGAGTTSRPWAPSLTSACTAGSDMSRISCQKL